MAYETTDMYEVVSSNVAAFGYDFDEGNVLYVRFNNGQVYWYVCEPDVYEQMMMADSKGRFIHTNLKGFYDSGRLE